MQLEILLAICVIYILWRWLRPAKRAPHLTKEFEAHITDVMANVDDCTFTEEEEGDFSTTTNRGRFQAKVIAAAKAEFGLLQRTHANRLMVRKFMRDLMRDRKMRPSHIAKELDVSVSIFFIPSKSDIEAYKVNASLEAMERDGEVSSVWESYYGALGRMLGFSSA